MKPKTGKIIKCQQCKKEFYIAKNRFETAKFCSPYCRGHSAQRRFKKPCAICGKEFEFIHVRKDRAKYCSRLCYHRSQLSKGTKTYKCKECHKLFWRPPSHAQVFCNRECRYKYQRKNVFSENWTTIRKQFQVRDWLKSCAICGWKKFPKLLGIHHKDRNKENNKKKNLVVLCPNCHSEAHNKHIVH